jgi:hypothetical protein
MAKYLVVSTTNSNDSILGHEWTNMKIDPDPGLFLAEFLEEFELEPGDVVELKWRDFSSEFEGTILSFKYTP